MLYDVFIPFFLIYSRTRYVAFFFVIVFHALTKVFFPAIGMFPYIMIFSAVIFFDSKLHILLLEKIKMVLNNTLTFFKIKISNTSKTVNKPKREATAARSYPRTPPGARARRRRS